MSCYISQLWTISSRLNSSLKTCMHSFFLNCMLAGLGKRMVSPFETVVFGFGFSISHLKSSLGWFDLEVLRNVQNWGGRVTLLTSGNASVPLPTPKAHNRAPNKGRNILFLVPQYIGFASSASIGIRWDPSRVPSRTRIPGSTHTYLTGVWTVSMIWNRGGIQSSAPGTLSLGMSSCVASTLESKSSPACSSFSSWMTRERIQGWPQSISGA